MKENLIRKTDHLIIFLILFIRYLLIFSIMFIRYLLMFLIMLVRQLLFFKKKKDERFERLKRSKCDEINIGCDIIRFIDHTGVKGSIGISSFNNEEISFRDLL